jgi:beta-N-acetylhexosaminidase
VADVDSNPKNPVIGDRAFSSSAEECAAHGVAFLQAMQARGMIACSKHFPGHGDTAVDSHFELPVVEKEPPDLEAVEMVPFRAAIQAGVGMVMTSHVMFPVIDEQHPATMSSPIIRGWLRDKLGFSGVVCSDDMEMKAVRGRWPIREQLDRACRATVDLLIISESLDLAWESWETAVHLQEDDPRHHDLAKDSLRRLDALRERFFLRPTTLPGLECVGSTTHQALAEMIRVRGMA